MKNANAIKFSANRPFCYQWQDSLLRSKDLHAYAKYLGMLLVNYMNSEKNYCFPSIARLSEQSSLNKKTVIKYLKELAAAGFIAVKKRIVNGAITSNIYHLLTKKDYKTPTSEQKSEIENKVYNIADGGVPRTPSYGTTGGGVVYDVHPNNQMNNQTNNKTHTRPTVVSCDQQTLFDIDDEQPNKKQTRLNQQKITQQLDEKFDRFWDAYPKKVDKKKAYKAFKRINPTDDLFENIMSALTQANAFTWRNIERRYIPNPSTWLNGERWSDDLVASNSGPQENKNGAYSFADAVRNYMNR